MKRRILFSMLYAVIGTALLFTLLPDAEAEATPTPSSSSAPSTTIYLVNGDYFFSVSHAGKYVCIAVSDKGNIGVDIEHMKGMKYALMRHFCTEEDVRFIMGEKPADTAVMTDYDTISRFFTVWTYKEAYVKCTGEGFTDTVLKISYDKNRCTTKILEDYVICAVEAQEL